MLRRLWAGILAVTSLTGGMAVLGSTAAEAQPAAVSDTLLPGQKLMALQSIKSKSGVFTLTMQRSGVVTLLQRGDKQPLWQTETYRPGAVLVMGQDGMLRIIWGRTQLLAIGAASAGAKLVLPNTGLLATYNTRGKAVWNRHMVIGTLTPGVILNAPSVGPGREVILYSVSHAYTVQMLDSGSLVLLKNGKTVLWTTGKSGLPKGWAVMRADGTLSTYNVSNDETWQYDTRRPGTVAQVRDDGSFLLINGKTVVKKFH
ncbi:hypothetical protein [Kribbella jiaozuonensis]|uniref:Bulb-type lectin domain-containing protein n=1 Tax=Kribbella jiaozuonensis TaxID=2575441 RepID=A0A4V5UWT8_9ACTN|nr:hypothetical protein [Kribbella jiaozuonensis]TKK78173.1 hypothetical protein FDA38_24075 [Kribbella jiaozuonensis]